MLPAYWDRGVAQRLMKATMALFTRWGVRHTGLFTFPASPKHLGLYQKFGYYPRYLTAVMTRTPEVDTSTAMPVLLSTLPKAQRAKTIQACAQLTNGVDKGLDVTGEIRAVLAQQGGDVVLCFTGSVLDAFAVCLNGPGSEGGEKECYVKFGAARRGKGAGERFDRLLIGCDGFAASRGARIEAGINLAREQAYRHMISHGYRVSSHGVAMERPHGAGFDRSDAWVIADWR